MSAIIQSRRGFISGLGALFVAAPAIVRATSIMPVKAIDPALTHDEMIALLNARMEDAYRVTRESMARLFYGDPETTPMEFSGITPVWSVDVIDRRDYEVREWAVPIDLDASQIIT